MAKFYTTIFLQEILLPELSTTTSKSNVFRLSSNIYDIDVKKNQACAQWIMQNEMPKWAVSKLYHVSGN